jgi:c-di-GMP-binding flagellar brake protein YcgR
LQKLFFIDSPGGELKPVRSYLSDVVECVEFGSVMEVIRSRETPDVILLAADVDPEHLKKDLFFLKGNSFYAKIPRIIFLPPHVSASYLKTAGIEKESALRLPVVKSEVIARLAGIQKRAHRRMYELLIGVQPEGNGRKYFGKSLDFSETGIAFECNEQICEHQCVVVSFVVPRTRRRFILETDIVRRRSDHPGALFAYGAAFRNMTDRDKRDLMDFITGTVHAKTEVKNEA